MGKIIKPGATCDSCGLHTNADEQIWITDKNGLYSFCKKCSVEYV